MAAEDALQTIQGQVIGVLAGNDLRQQPRPGQPFLNGGEGLLVSRDDGGFTLLAGVFVADMLNNI